MASKANFRITTFFRRRPDITEEQFYHHWETIHAPLVIPWAIQHGVVEYIQFRTPQSSRKTISELMDPAFSGSIDYNAAVDFYVESYERFIAAYHDPYYLSVIEPDEQRFVDKGQIDGGKRTVVRAMSTLGTAKSMIKDGKAAVQVKSEIWENWQKLKETKPNQQ